ncbi:hypothetical protein GCM10009120_22560 [Sphingobacterium siyangense subsp. cladoniae]
MGEEKKDQAVSKSQANCCSLYNLYLILFELTLLLVNITTLPQLSLQIYYKKTFNEATSLAQRIIIYQYNYLI